jgi:hypothetical protein
MKSGSSTPDPVLGLVDTPILSTKKISPAEFMQSIHVSGLRGGILKASKESERIQNPSKECVLPTLEATSLLTTPSGEISGDLGGKGW